MRRCWRNSQKYFDLLYIEESEGNRSSLSACERLLKNFIVINHFPCLWGFKEKEINLAAKNDLY